MRAARPRSWSSSAPTSWSFRPPRPRNGSTPSTGTGRKPRSSRGPPAVGRRTSPAWMSAFELPPELADADTIGVIYDEIGGLNFYNEYGMLRDLFADPALASDKRYADVLRGYLRAETIGPLPFRRLAAAHPADGRRRIPEDPAPATLHLGRARRGSAAPAQVLVLRARALSEPQRDRCPPRRAHQPVNGRGPIRPGR